MRQKNKFQDDLQTKLRIEYALMILFLKCYLISKMSDSQFSTNIQYTARG
mgnify:CR=1 FL=1